MRLRNRVQAKASAPTRWVGFLALAFAGALWIHRAIPQENDSRIWLLPVLAALELRGIYIGAMFVLGCRVFAPGLVELHRTKLLVLLALGICLTVFLDLCTTLYLSWPVSLLEGGALSVYWAVSPVRSPARILRVADPMLGLLVCLLGVAIGMPNAVAWHPSWSSFDAIAAMFLDVLLIVIAIVRIRPTRAALVVGLVVLPIFLRSTVQREWWPTWQWSWLLGVFIVSREVSAGRRERESRAGKVPPRSEA